VPREVFPYHNPFQSFVHYFSIYVFGMFVSHYREQVFEFLQRYWAVIFAAFLLAIFAQFYLRFIVNLLYFMEMAAYFKIIFGSLLMVYFFRRYDHLIKNRFEQIALMSFGIYFVHGYVLSVTRLVLRRFELQIPGNLLTYLLLFGFTMVSTLLILWVLKQILGKHSRKLVGY
jgi:hypothetical protein